MKKLYLLFVLSVGCATSIDSTHEAKNNNELFDAGGDLEDLDAGGDLEDLDAGGEQLEDVDAGGDLEDLDAGGDLEDLNAGGELGCCFYFYEVFDNPDDYRPGDDIKYNICVLPDSPADKIPHCED